jgi:branched-chain amino acid transport system ATP-binding protein
MALLEVLELTKAFGGLIANNRINFSVDAGTILGVIGPNGSGKTTLFNCISGFHTPTSGRVLFGGRNIAGAPPHRICRLGLARTFQIAEVFTRMTVLENVMVGAFKKDKGLGSAREMAMKTLKLVGLAGKAGESGKALSPPERRKLSFAMALATGPQILMLDEAMAGLLPAEIDELLLLIREIKKKGVAVLVIEHVMDAVMSIAESILVLEAGRVIAQGTPQQIAANEQVIKAYLGEDFRHAAG